jgi:hypothetical protein
MTTALQVAANRCNARQSSGPKSRAGKSRAARNARRHGLATPIWSDPALASATEALARELAGPAASPELQSLAREAAAAHIAVDRVRRACHRLMLQQLEDPLLLPTTPRAAKQHARQEMSLSSVNASLRGYTFPGAFVHCCRHLTVPKNTHSPFPIWRATSLLWNATSATRCRSESGHCENLLRNNVSQRESPMWKRATKSIGTGKQIILAERTQNSQCFQRQSDSSVEGTTLFDLFLELQNARLPEQPSTKQSNWLRFALRRLRESLIAGQTKTTDKPATSDVSRELALSWLLSRDDNGPL